MKVSKVKKHRIKLQIKFHRDCTPAELGQRPPNNSIRLFLTKLLQGYNCDFFEISYHVPAHMMLFPDYFVCFSLASNDYLFCFNLITFQLPLLLMIGKYRRFSWKDPELYDLAFSCSLLSFLNS